MTFHNTEHMSRFAKCKYYCRTGSTFLFSHIGLCSLVFGYTVMGAFTFEALESPHEKQIKETMITARENVTKILWELTESSDILNETAWTHNATDILLEYQEIVREAMNKYGYDGVEDTKIMQWSFSGALLFSIIVITTIGYGNITPRTPTGKIITILYAIIGIPLLLLCLSNIGDAMAHSFKFMYWKVCCYLCSSPKSSSHKKSRSNKSSRYPSEAGTLNLHGVTGDSLGHRMYGTPTDSFNRHRNYPSATGSLHHSLNRNHSYYSTREGEFSDAHKVPIISNKYAIHPIDSSDLQHPLHRMNTMDTPPYRHSGAIMRQTNRMQEPFLNLNDELSFDAASSLSSEKEEEDEEEEANVPVMMCISIVVGYICGGALLFSQWEGWEYFDSCYFCFITLTTIGFGDFVPGGSVLSEDAQVSLGVCSLYLLFGMALLAMSFNLVQAEVTKTVSSIGKRLGIVSDEDDDDDDM